ncbi:unnamed protein product [Paramecium sonneborni]|uniref:TtsA-like Glycoside hydrolase family 108 domain-containing protein n=1 Tax=Paramecium sonneborni TaxID=65129 RepID=A0A8S1RD34_9CILI|nr:unnamed protein product [Paramecium sonneborni]
MVKDDKFFTCLKYIMESEGGDINHKDDRGGATRQGVSQKAYNNYQKELGNNGKIKSVLELTKDQIEDFYYYYYKKYNVDKIEDINSCYLYFDTVILQGPDKAARMAQNVCNIKVDGCFVKNNPKQEVFFKGWINRVDRIYNQIQNSTIQQLYNQYQNKRTQERYDKNNQQTQNLNGIDCNIDLSVLNRIKGVNKMCARFLIESQENIILSDLATVLSVLHGPKLKDEHKGISFSLDPIIIPNQQEFKQQQKVCWPDAYVERNIIQDTELAKILFDADYLLKLMSLGVESDGKTPFKYPQELQQLGFNSCSNMGKQKQQQMLYRFWLVPQQCFYTQINNKYVIDDIQVACQARQIERVNNKLKDKICQDVNDTAYQFAAKFTKLYDKIAKYYPIFNRLKQLFKAAALGRWMYINKIKINYQDIVRFSRKVDNSPKAIPILKYEQVGEQNKIPIYFTQSEKIQVAKEYLIEKGHPTTQDLINQILKQIPDLKGYQVSTSVQYSQGGVDTHCQNMIESKQDPKLDKFKTLDEVDIPFFPQKKCTNCNRMIECHLQNLDQNQCSIHNEYTCYLCLDLITNQQLNPKSCIINNYRYIFHQNCYNEYQEIINRKHDDDDDLY